MKRAVAAARQNHHLKAEMKTPWCLLWALLLCLGMACQAFGAGGDIVWQYGDAQAGKQQPVASAVDGSGNVFVTGYQNLAGGTNDDYWTVKFKADGSGVAWRASFDKAGGSDQATAIATDTNGDVIVTGFVWNGLNKDIHTIKYSGGTGAVLWQHTFNGAANGNDMGTAVATDSLNNVYVGGYSQNAAGNDDFVLLKYAASYPDGNVAPVWQASYGGAAGGNDQLSALTVGADGVAVTGQSWNGTSFDMTTLKYDFNGNQLWLARHGATGGASGKKLIMDAAGNVIATGSAGNGIDLDIYTVKYNGATGVTLWERTYNGAYDDEPYGLTLDASGDVYVTGYTWTLTGTNDFYTARYNGGTGALVWQQIFDSGQDNTDLAIAISAALDPAGDLFVTGYTVAAGVSSFQTIKYKRDNGNQLWQRSFNGFAGMNSRPVGLGLAPSGELLVAGWGDTPGNGLDGYVVKYDPGLLNPPTNLTTATQQDLSLQLSWTDNSDNEDGFKIERKLGENGSYLQIATVPANTTTYTDPGAGLTPNNYYYYRVRAFNAANGDSHYSNEAHGLTVFVNFAAPAWSYLYNNPDNMDDYANGIAVGPDNNPVVTGYSLRALGGFDYFTAKLNRADKSVIWSDLYDDPDSEMDVAKCVAVDGSNNAVVSGFSQMYSAAAQKNINSIYTIKYPAAGPPQSWGVQYNGPGAIDDRAVAIASTTDAANNVLVIGYGKNAASNDDIYVVKYNADGTKAWAAAPFDAGVGGDDIPSAVAVAPDGSVYVTGYSEKGTSTGVYNFFTAKYNGASGALIWSDVYSVTGGGDNRGSAIAIDANGDAYVTGYAVTGAGDKDFYTIKYSGQAASAQRVWERSLDGLAHGDDEAVGVKVDAIDGAIVVAGTTLTKSGDHDITVIRYTAAGDTVWQQTLQRPANDDYATAMTMDSSGYIYIAGDTSNGVSMDMISLIYNYDGTFLGASSFNGAANGDDEASSIAVNYKGEAFIAGYSTNGSGNADYAVIKQSNNFILVPAPFTATAQPDFGKMSFSWGNNSPGTSFNIERTLGPITGSNLWTPIATGLAPGTTTFQDSGLNAGTNYCYRIEAYSGSLFSRKIVTCATTALAAPVLNPVSVVSANAIDLSWNNVAGNTGYKLERSVNNSSWAQIGGTLAAGTVLYHDTGLTAGTVYYYRVSTLNVAGASVTSGVQTAPVLNAPTGVTSAVITLSWPAVTGITGFKVERSTDNLNWTQVSAPAASATGWSDGTIAAGVLYYYRLKTVSAVGDSGPSAVQSAMSKLATPVITSAAASSTTQINLVWTDPNNNETGMLLEYAACNQSNTALCTNLNNDPYWGSWTSNPLTANTTSTSIGSLTPGRTYRFRVTATLSGANSNPSTYVAASANLLGPTNLTATAATTSTVTLAWTDVLGESNYSVEQNGTLLTGVTLAQDANFYTVTGLSLNTQYCFRVVPYNAASTAYSNSACVTLYGAPTLNSVTVNSQNQVTLGWSDVAGETGFDVQRSVATYQYSQPASASTGNWNAYTDLTATALTAGTTSYPNSGLVAGYAYKYKIRYKLPDGSFSPFSNEVMTTTIPPTPALYVRSWTTSQINVYWYDGYGETNYNTQFKERLTGSCSTEDWSATATNSVGANVTSYAATGLTAGSTYCIRLNASNAGGASTWGTPLTQVTYLPAPTLNAPSGMTQSQISLSWNDVTGNYGYKVEHSTDNVNWSQAGTTTTSVISYNDSGLAPNQIYYYRVSTKNSAGAYSSPASNVLSASTLAVPSPTLTGLSGITTSQIILTWSDVSGNAGYKVEQSPDNTTWTQLATPAQGATSYTSTGLSAGTLYYYRVSTKNSVGGLSTPSNVLPATTTPAVPVLTAGVASAAEIDLSWQVMLGATSYKVLRSVGPAGPFSQVGNPAVAYATLYCGLYSAPSVGCPTLVPVASGYADAGLVEDTQYCYQLKAWNATGGDSAASGTACVKTPAVGGPVLTSVSAPNSQKVQLVWSYNPAACTPTPCGTPDGYEIWRQIWNGDWVRIGSSGVTGYTDSIGIEPQKSYSYKVRAYKGADTSAFSSVVRATTPAYVAGDHTCNFTATVVTSGPGAVSAQPPGVPVSCGTGQSCSAYCAGAQVTLTAIPNSGAAFVGWSGACSGPSASCAVTISADSFVSGAFQ